ncbi:MAG: hypothetical protein AAF711_10400 [Planctomycetota bacterium]
MTSNNNEEDQFLSEPTEDEGMNTMAVLSSLGGSGGEEPLAEGEPLGLDPDAGKAKLSGSTLAVGVVVVLGVVTLLGMKLTLGALNGGAGPSEAMAEIDSFIAKQTAAKENGVDGPIKAPDEESNQVLEELKQDPTDHQVPAEEVEKDPFVISQIVKPKVSDQPNEQGPATDPREIAAQRAQAAASRLKIDGISGPIVFIDGKDYRVGEVVGDGLFELVSIDGLTCIIRTRDEYAIALRLRYR